jgi:hypothetical protein
MTTTLYAMEQNTATPQPDWAALGWITHRQPTAKDADGLGEVAVPNAIGATPRTGDARCSGFRLIVPGQPWWSQYAPEPGHPTAPTEPTPTETDRITALEQRVAESIHALEQRLSSLEQLFWAHKHLEQRVAELEATMEPSAELSEDISYQQLKVKQMRTSAALLIAHANLIEAQP